MSHQKLQHPIENPGDLTREGIALFKQMTIAMAEANQSFHLRQIEAVQAAVAEHTRQFKSQLKETGDTCSALEQWSELFQSRMLQCGKIGGTWIEHTSQTISRMSELLASPLDAAAASAMSSEDPVERRVSATVITFPERRAAEAVKAVKNASGSSRVAPKRHSA